METQPLTPNGNKVPRHVDPFDDDFTYQMHQAELADMRDAVRKEFVKKNDSYVKPEEAHAKLCTKLLNIQNDLQSIKKTGTFKGPKFSYEFIEEAEVSKRVSTLCVKHKVHIKPSLINSEVDMKTMNDRQFWFAKVEMLYQISDAETGYSFYINSSGVGLDSGDKAIYKASTGCHKYALLRLFCLGSGDDPEAGGQVDTNINFPVADNNLDNTKFSQGPCGGHTFLQVTTDPKLLKQGLNYAKYLVGHRAKGNRLAKFGREWLEYLDNKGIKY